MSARRRGGRTRLRRYFCAHFQHGQAFTSQQTLRRLRGNVAKRQARDKSGVQVEAYRDPQTTQPTRPEVGTQSRFQVKDASHKYRYDSSLSPSLEWDDQNPAREQAEALIRQILDAATLTEHDEGGQAATAEEQLEKAKAALAQAKAAADELRRMSGPFLNWAGKAERQSFDVPTLPLFIHERLSTKAILETLRAHRRGQQQTLFDWFADPQHAIVDQLRAYEHRDPWVNRLILGDNLQVMNSLIHLEKMAGQVQMIYVDPPYGVKFGSNFQPFVRKRDVTHNDDEDMTREPEMVQAFRDTWELGLHSYLTFLRDRLLLCRELLNPSGSIFVQINDENLHHVRELMDNVFGVENYLNTIPFVKTTGVTTRFLASNVDFLLWYARDKEQAKYRTLYLPKSYEAGTAENYGWIELPDGRRRGLTRDEKNDRNLIPSGAKVYKPDNITSQGNPVVAFEYEGKVYHQAWKTNIEGLRNLAANRRLHVAMNSLQYVRYLTDFPCVPVTQLWEDTGTGNFTDPKIYVVQTGAKVIERCILMTTDPGDVVLDPTCGSGTTAYVAEQWGRRWVTIDTSRVPLALTRQRLLTATFPWYGLKDESRGPAGGFVYKRKQNKKGEEIGGIVPHVTLKSIANNEPPEEEVLVDRPEVVKDIVRVTGPFTVEATIAPTADFQDGSEASDPDNEKSYPERMLEVLRRSPRLHLPGNRTIEFSGTRVLAQPKSLFAEAALVNGKSEPVAVALGPEHGAVSERFVFAAAQEANGKKHFVHLVVIGFAIEPNARRMIDDWQTVSDIPITYVQATMDLTMGDLLKNMKSSQILSVCGSPEIAVKRLPAAKGEAAKYQVTLLGLDVFNPITMEVDHRDGDDVPAWFLCTDYNDRVFHIRQAFFPRTAAWDNLKRSLKGVYDDSLWQHLAGTTSAPFEAGEHRQIAVKVIDDRGNELMVVRKLDTAEEAKPHERTAAAERPERPADKPEKKAKKAALQPAVARVTGSRRRKR